MRLKELKGWEIKSCWILAFLSFLALRIVALAKFRSFKATFKSIFFFLLINRMQGFGKITNYP